MTDILKNTQSTLMFDGVKLKMIYVKETTLAQKCVQKILQTPSSCIGLDIETGKKHGFLDDPMSGLCPYRSFISLVQIYDGVDTVYIFDTFFINLFVLQPIFDEKRTVAHNAMFELQHFMHNGIKNIKIDCTMVMYNMLSTALYVDMADEEASINTNVDFITKADRYGASLKAVTAKILGVNIPKSGQLSNWTERPLNTEQLRYAALDAYLPHALGRALSKGLIEQKMATVYALNRRALHPVCDMILNGCEIDTRLHRRHIADWQKQLVIQEKKVYAIFGDRINLNAPGQIAYWIENNVDKAILVDWPRSEKSGNLKTDAKTFDEYSEQPFIAPLLKYKKVKKLISTYGTSLIDKICPVTKRIHAGFTLGYTATGRLSGRNPNLQNLPADVDIRGIFRATKGATLIGADYGQIEMRTAAYLTKDKTMIKAFNEGTDLHKLVVSAVTDKKIEDVSSEERQLGKSINFGLLFGMGAPGLIRYAKYNYGVTLSEQESQDAVAAFRSTYSDYTAWQKRQREACERALRVATKLGKRRKLAPDGGYTKSVNHPVQGSAAEIMLTALCNVYDEFGGTDKVKLINCVHDELLLETKTVSEKSIEETKNKLQKCMHDAMLSMFPDATLNSLIEVKSGKTWQECH